MPLQRYKLTIAYRGTAYHGWQFQLPSNTWKGEIPKAGRGIPTVQETLRRALEEVVRHPVTLVGSSRTDARVHAKGQVAHFDTDQGQIPAEGMRRAVGMRSRDGGVLVGAKINALGDNPGYPVVFGALLRFCRLRYFTFIRSLGLSP